MKFFAIVAAQAIAVLICFCDAHWVPDERLIDEELTVDSEEAVKIEDVLGRFIKEERLLDEELVELLNPEESKSPVSSEKLSSHGETNFFHKNKFNLK